jgi:hypothetical protein
LHGGGESLKVLRVIEGSYKPGVEEAFKLAVRAGLNKLLLPYLRSLGGALAGELEREEARFNWFMGNAVEVVGVLENARATYALYKFRRPVDHVSVDLDILVEARHIPASVASLRDRGFRVVVQEPYTVTMERSGFIVDLYTQPSFAWVVYMDGGRLIREEAEEIELNGAAARALSREGEVAVAAAHAVYKEHMVLLMDCLVAWSWLNKRAWSIAVEHGVEGSLETLLESCSHIRRGLVEAPYKLKPHTLIKAYAGKMVHDPLFRGTLPNILRYSARRDLGLRISTRLTRRSY